MLVRPQVLAVLVTAVVALAPLNVLAAYLPLALDTGGGTLVALFVLLGVGQVVGNRLVGRRGPVAVTLAGVGATAVCLALVGAARGSVVLVGVLLLVLGLASAQLVTPRSSGCSPWRPTCRPSRSASTGRRSTSGWRSARRSGAPW
ncbi:hypothetical protein GCM10025864_22660 [Luteimicrobium album]|uniref:Major facilitator superfamily (MFS) profile domain-containing protein n=1 Tax=Luteimicrobium album TaxID=1054550 RepID=A0ABQ6I1K7_9MICO|nr:hypothetical protein GCM10025864_22660 [Luteimicrobium album]